MKKRLSLFLALLMLVSLFAGFGVTAQAADAALSVYTQTGSGEAVLAKSYTAAELAALAEKGTASYVYYKKDAANAVVATEYVTLSALLTDAGASFAEGDSLAFTCSDGPYSKGDFSYETMSARGVDQTGAAVPSAFALTWETGNLADTTVADIAAGAKNTGNIRFVSGMTAAEATDKSAAGNRMPSDVVAVTVVGKPVVQLSTQKVTLGGQVVPAQAYNISGYNYFKLRDVAALLGKMGVNFSVSFDNAEKTVSVTAGEAYVPVGGELTTGTDKSSSCVLSAWTVSINGEVKDIVAYNIGGNNYFKLRDLGDAMGFTVSYDNTTRTVQVSK